MANREILIIALCTILLFIFSAVWSYYNSFQMWKLYYKNKEYNLLAPHTKTKLDGYHYNHAQSYWKSTVILEPQLSYVLMNTPSYKFLYGFIIWLIISLFPKPCGNNFCTKYQKSSNFVKEAKLINLGKWQKVIKCQKWQILISNINEKCVKKFLTFGSFMNFGTFCQFRNFVTFCKS